MSVTFFLILHICGVCVLLCISLSLRASDVAKSWQKVRSMTQRNVYFQGKFEQNLQPNPVHISFVSLWPLLAQCIDIKTVSIVIYPMVGSRPFYSLEYIIKGFRSGNARLFFILNLVEAMILRAYSSILSFVFIFISCLFDCGCMLLANSLGSCHSTFRISEVSYDYSDHPPL